MQVKGKVFKYGNDVDTDVIIPARYLNTTSESELAAHCMEDLDGEFVKRVKAGDIIVAGDNFGCGSSTRPDSNKGKRYKPCDSKLLCKNILPQFDKHRFAHFRMPAGGCGDK